MPVLIVFNPHPGVRIVAPQELALYGMRIVQQVMVKGSQVCNAMMKIIIRHLGIAKAGKISMGSQSCLFHLLRPVERRIHHMDLTTWLQEGQGQMQDLLERWEILDGSGKHDDVEPPVVQHPGTDIPMDEPQVRIIVEDPRRLLQLGEIDIDPRHLCSG